MKALVNKIVPMSVVDGPGNRTAIFFQGCNFHCKYCHNPETINTCISCGKCLDTCPSQALIYREKKVVWLQEKCIDCDRCLSICPHDSSPKVKEFTPEELAQEVEKNQPFISGVTTSGGECTLEYKFLQSFFSLIHKLGLSCLVDTNGSLDLSLEKFQEFVKESDGFMLDIKAWDKKDHLEITGQENSMPIKNLEYLFLMDKLKEVRMVCLDSLDNKETILQVSQLLKRTKNKALPTLKLISYREYGVREQYHYLKAPSYEEMNSLKSFAMDHGFKDIIVI